MPIISLQAASPPCYLLVVPQITRVIFGSQTLNPKHNPQVYLGPRAFPLLKLLYGSIQRWQPSFDSIGALRITTIVVLDSLYVVLGLGFRVLDSFYMFRYTLPHIGLKNFGHYCGLLLFVLLLCLTKALPRGAPAHAPPVRAP